MNSSKTSGIGGLGFWFSMILYEYRPAVSKIAAIFGNECPEIM
ncbi:hypothetical protein LEP1GSC061_1957 [Leptospira wolffii serovar Khorat str. Khorat-H2]|nr:hypothetical protein LEP1GSC061_1957 [Leptospira wolffii serovar Khorat str. Khorat-H2]